MMSAFGGLRGGERGLSKAAAWSWLEASTGSRTEPSQRWG